jgi:Flp pilus assembly protein TadG
MPVLMAFFVATAEFGRYFYSYSTLAKATRAGARYLATAPIKLPGSGPNGGTNPAEDNRAKRLVVYGDPNAADGSKPVVPGLTVNNVELVRTGKHSTVPETVTVRIVNYKYTPLLNLGGFASNLKWTSVPVKPSTTMRFLLNQPST